ncbi:unnamed protein product [Arctogadus glacialis]
MGKELVVFGSRPDLKHACFRAVLTRHLKANIYKLNPIPTGLGVWPVSRGGCVFFRSSLDQLPVGCGCEPKTLHVNTLEGETTGYRR